MVQIEVCELVGSSPAMASLRREIAVAAKSSAKVLITGESGVGKDLTARRFHRQSTRRSQPFRAINCASVPDTLLESELFGHVRGSFTGAVRDQQGPLRIRARRNGASSTRSATAARVCKACSCDFCSLASSRRSARAGSARHVDVRVVATTQRDLLEQVSEGEFRLDLYYRLNVIRIDVPPLRDRVEDIPDLDRSFRGEVQPALPGALPGDCRRSLGVAHQLPLAWQRARAAKPRGAFCDHGEGGRPRSRLACGRR